MLALFNVRNEVYVCHYSNDKYFLVWISPRIWVLENIKEPAGFQRENYVFK